MFSTESYQATLTPRSWVSTLRTTWLALTLIVARSWRPSSPSSPRQHRLFRGRNPSRNARFVFRLSECSSDSSCCQATCRKKAHPATRRPLDRATRASRVKTYCGFDVLISCDDPFPTRDDGEVTTAVNEPSDPANDHRRVKDRESQVRYHRATDRPDFRTTWSSNTQNTSHPINRDSMRSLDCHFGSFRDSKTVGRNAFESRS